MENSSLEQARGAAPGVRYPDQLPQRRRLPCITAAIVSFIIGAGVGFVACVVFLR